MKRLCLLLLVSVSMASAFVAPAMAQVHSGTVSGAVQDQQGGLLPGATITLTGSDRTLTFVTGEDGRYRFLNLPPGTYRLTAELSGFSSLVRDNMRYWHSTILRRLCAMFANASHAKHSGS